jgi:hypothetical protein
MVCFYDSKTIRFLFIIDAYHFQSMIRFIYVLIYELIVYGFFWEAAWIAPGSSEMFRPPSAIYRDAIDWDLDIGWDLDIDWGWANSTAAISRQPAQVPTV